MQRTKIILAIIKEGYIRIIPIKFCQNPASSQGWDDLWGKLLTPDDHAGRRTYNDHNSSQWAKGSGELIKTYIKQVFLGAWHFLTKCHNLNKLGKVALGD